MACYVSNQIADHAHALGIEMAIDNAKELLSINKIKMANQFFEVIGRRHCRLGVKPAMRQRKYLNSYSKQYARENSFFRPF